MSAQNKNENGEANGTLVESFNKHYADYLKRYSNNRGVIDPVTDTDGIEPTDPESFHVGGEEDLFFIADGEVITESEHATDSSEEPVDTDTEDESELEFFKTEQAVAEEEPTIVETSDFIEDVVNAEQPAGEESSFEDLTADVTEISDDKEEPTVTEIPVTVEEGSTRDTINAESGVEKGSSFSEGLHISQKAPITETSSVTDEDELIALGEEEDVFTGPVDEDNHFLDNEEENLSIDPDVDGHQIEEEVDELGFYEPERPVSESAPEIEQPAQSPTIVEREIVREVIVVDREQAVDLGYGAASRYEEESKAVTPALYREAPAPYRPEEIKPKPVFQNPVPVQEEPAYRSSESTRTAEKGGLFSRFRRSKDSSSGFNRASESEGSSYNERSRVVEEGIDTPFLGSSDEDKIISLKTQSNYDPRDERRRLQHVTTEQRDVDPAVWLEQTMLDALKLDASDLHIVVDGETKDLRARIRVDGQMQDFDYVTGIPARVIMGRLKAATELSSGGSFAPEETIYTINLDGEARKARAVLFRVEDGGEALVMRLPLTGNLRQLDELAFSDTNLQHVLDLLAMPYKLIMIAGPMGSGKTTTAHGALLHVADPTRTVWTIEDPVERRLPNLVQLEIDEENGAGFDVLLAKLLRADYNTLFLGEIRDNATASAAVRQAKAGRQVMSTIHADDNIKSLMRLIELAGDSPMSVLSAVGGVISQRLVRKLNPEWDGIDQSKKYKGRVPIHEILFVNDSIVEVMMQDRPLSEIKQQVRAAKGSTFRDDAIRLIEAGVTDRDEVVKVIGEFDAEDRY